MDQSQTQQIQFQQKMQERNISFNEQMQQQQFKANVDISRQQQIYTYHQQMLHEVMQPVQWVGSVGLVAVFAFVLISRGIRSGEVRAIRNAEAEEVVAKYQGEQQ